MRGSQPWSLGEIRASLPAFAALYADRPIHDNDGGMKAPHMFATWFMLRALKPRVVIESGVWRGQGTWLIEHSCPEAQIYCIDPNLERLSYRSERAIYSTLDFGQSDWTGVPKDRSVVFFDDHQNAYDRVRQAYWYGFEHLIFEDNYPPGTGDVYSLRKVQAGVGHAPSFGWSDRVRNSLKALMGRLALPSPTMPNEGDAKHLASHIETYFEFPPVFSLETSRFGIPWELAYGPIEPVLQAVEEEWQKVFIEEAKSYTSICYAKLR